MHRKDIKMYGNQRGGLFEQENEPEEGEIVDEFELIVSSDEELSMRQRIRELEAENEEIEQIAVISRSYVDELKPLRNNLDSNRAARVPTDASSISSTEFVTPKKRKRRKSKERKRKHCQHHQRHNHHHHHQSTYSQDQLRHDQQLPQQNTIKTHNSHSRKSICKRRQKIIAKKHGREHSNRYLHKEIIHDTVTLDSPNSSDSSSSLSDSETFSKNSLSSKRKNDVYNNGSYITRDTLRLAVARHSNDSRISQKKSCLKDKLLRQELVSHATNGLKEKEEEVLEYDDADDDVEVIEPEIDIQTVDEDSSEDSMEEKELRLIALKSAVLKKHMARKRRNAEIAYSPTDFDMLNMGVSNGGENKLDDIDVVDLEEDDTQNACVIVSPEASPQLMMLEDQDDSQQMMDCKPIDMDIANSDSEDATEGAWSKALKPTFHTFSYASHEFAQQFRYNMYMNEIELPPPPPGVDDYEEPPPPPPRFAAYDTDMQDMELDNEELIMEELMSEAKSKECSEQETNKFIASASDVKQEEVEEEVDEEEEEEALRALLLAKFQSPKNQKKQQPDQSHAECKENLNESAVEEQKIQPKKPIESILKEAVKRLQIHSQPDVLKEKSLVNQQMDIISSNDNSKDNTFKIHAYEEEDSNESMQFLGPLKKRLLELKHQSQLKEREEFTMENEENLPTRHTAHNQRQEINQETENSFNLNDTPAEKECYNENLANCSEFVNTVTTNTVDISDITRRLQKLKDEILSATKKQEPSEESITEELNQAREKTHFEEISNIPDRNEELVTIKPILERNITHTPKPFHNNEDINTDIDSNILAKHKIVKADFDAVKNVTTFKITISNSPAVIADINEITTSIEDSSLKENNINIATKPPQLEKELPKTIKNSQGEVKTTKVKISNEVGNENATPISKTTITLKTAVVATKANTVTNALPPPPPSSYSLLRSTKIVKPNKVINNNMDLKRRLTAQTKESTLPPAKTAKTETTTQLSKGAAAADNSRLINSFEQVKHMCKVPQFIISVHNSSNESSDNEWDDYDALYKPLYDYNDNASPLSLNLESPCFTPIRSNSPIESISNQPDTGFEEKLDKFLKTVRTTTVPAESVIEKTPQRESGKPSKGVANKTPLAVRHLPAAAQSEYRRLVHRMKLLETQRKSSNTTETTTNSTNDTQEPTASNEDTNKSENDNSTAANNSASKRSLVKQVLIRNANNNTTPSEPQNNSTSESAVSKYPKTNVLRSYENLYVKIGAGIVNHLDKSLRLVEEAKTAKVNKLKLEHRLNELKAEMELLQGQHKEEQQKISRIYPSICSTNEIITSLKQKRSKVFKAALTLGKTIKGEEYRLNNDLKQSIITKTKKLAIEIKEVNSLKAHDIVKIKINTDENKEEKKIEKKNEKEDEKKDENKEEKKDEKESENKEEKKEQKKVDKKEDKNDDRTEDKKDENREENPDENPVDNPHDNPDKTKELEESITKSKPEEIKDLQPATSPETEDDRIVIEIHTSTCIEEPKDQENVTATPPNAQLTTTSQLSGGNTENEDHDTPKNLQNDQDTKEEEKEILRKKEDDGIYDNCEEKSLTSYVSPLEHLRNMESNMDPNGVICPYDLMGNCEDVNCKFVHISSNIET